MAGKVGIAPGTTTLNIGPGGQVTLVGAPVNRQQDPGVAIRSVTGQLMDSRYFDARPTDFELSKIYGYTPVHRGWIAGELGACCNSCAVGSPCGSNLNGIDVGLETGMTIGGAALGAAVGAMALHSQGAGWAAVGAGVLGAALGFIGLKIARAVPAVD